MPTRRRRSSVRGKHFRFRREGKARIHRTPGVEHVRACLPWLHAELAAVRPRLLVTLVADLELAGRLVVGAADSGIGQMPAR
ncbi:MAG: hypothetical protein ACRDRG_04955 [Pseudonocardiaceae bacterium]